MSRLLRLPKSTTRCLGRKWDEMHPLPNQFMGCLLHDALLVELAPDPLVKHHLEAAATLASERADSVLTSWTIVGTTSAFGSGWNCALEFKRVLANRSVGR